MLHRFLGLIPKILEIRGGKKYVETIKRKSLSKLRGFRGADETRTRDLLRDRQAF